MIFWIFELVLRIWCLFLLGTYYFFCLIEHFLWHTICWHLWCAISEPSRARVELNPQVLDEPELHLHVTSMSWAVPCLAQLGLLTPLCDTLQYSPLSKFMNIIHTNLPIISISLLLLSPHMLTIVPSSQKESNFSRVKCLFTSICFVWPWCIDELY